MLLSEHHDNTFEVLCNSAIGKNIINGDLELVMSVQKGIIVLIVH